jgi:hypothetical protein
MFNLDQVERQSAEVDQDERWFVLEGRRFGDTSPMPLKVKVRSGGDKWQRGWTKGAQAYAKDLSPSARREFDRGSGNPLTINPDALPRANRAALRESGALLAVAVVGPELDDLDHPMTAAQEKIYGFKKLPASIRPHYLKRTDGKWAIPVQAEPPAEFRASDEQVSHLHKYPEFVNGVGRARQLLVEEGKESLEDELGNFVAGSGGAAGGAASPSPSEKD